MLTSLIGVVILLGGLIFFHELGHYTIARLFGVRVEVFSLGFGKKLISKKIGFTEYCLSLVPLGGYVKLLGDDPSKGVEPSLVPYAFSTQKLYKRFLIVAAGPISNFLLAIVLFMGIFWTGQPAMSTKIGNVNPQSPAYEAGFRAGDRIVDISGFKPNTWNEAEDFLKDKLGKKLEVRVQRGQGELAIPVEIMAVKVRNPYGEEVLAGGIKGISPNPLDGMVGISDPDSVAYKAGLRTGDSIIKIENRAIDSYEDISRALSSLWQPGKILAVTYRTKVDKKFEEKNTTITLPNKAAPSQANYFGVQEGMGIYPAEVFVYEVTEKSPAEKGGLKAGDRIVKIGGEVIYNFDSIVDIVQKIGAEGKSVAFEVERGGKKVSLDLKPAENTLEDPLTKQPIKKFLVGYKPQVALRDADMTAIQIRSPVELFGRAVKETSVLAWRMLVSLYKLAVGQVSVKNLGGPVLIATVAGKSLDAGWIPFFQMMALISINLFLLNLFPIPVLDGGHLFFYMCEAIKGKPLSVRTMERANQVGMFIILGLVALTLFNDISRIIRH